jgi:hypothetical protein
MMNASLTVSSALLNYSRAVVTHLTTRAVKFPYVLRK